jgi:hypothetical protein
MSACMAYPVPSHARSCVWLTRARGQNWVVPVLVRRAQATVFRKDSAVKDRCGGRRSIGGIQSANALHTIS